MHEFDLEVSNHPVKSRMVCPFWRNHIQENELKITFRRFLYAPVGRGRDSIVNR